jgi:hypothetical protein
MPPTLNSMVENEVDAEELVSLYRLLCTFCHGEV